MKKKEIGAQAKISNCPWCGGNIEKCGHTAKGNLGGE